MNTVTIVIPKGTALVFKAAVVLAVLNHVGKNQIRIARLEKEVSRLGDEIFQLKRKMHDPKGI